MKKFASIFLSSLLYASSALAGDVVLLDSYVKPFTIVVGAEGADDCTLSDDFVQKTVAPGQCRYVKETVMLGWKLYKQDDTCWKLSMGIDPRSVTIKTASRSVKTDGIIMRSAPFACRA